MPINMNLPLTCNYSVMTSLLIFIWLMFMILLAL